MEKKVLIISIIIISILFISGCNENTSNNGNSSNNKVPTTFYVDANGDTNFSSIQDAINTAAEGDIIFVHKGIYNEVLTLDKTIQLIGESRDETIINYNQPSAGIFDSTILISADNCIVKGFKIYSGESNISKKVIKVKSSNNIISDNVIINGDDGIYLDENTKYNNITRNNFSNSTKGIYLSYSKLNNISNNHFSSMLYNGIFTFASDNNAIFNNHFTNNPDHCIRIKSSKDNRVFGNNIIDNGGGIYVCCLSQNNIIFYNNFIQNTDYHASVGDPLVNQWNNESVGNYWDDYTENYQNATQENDIWQTPYIIRDDINKDMFPLVNPIDF
jgi:parallel beta-helix repeat protein